MKSTMGLTGAEKAAVLFLSMGKESAVKIAEFLSREELARVVEAAHELPSLGHETISQLVKEFGKNYASFGLAAGFDDLSQLFEKMPAKDTGKPDSNKQTNTIKTVPPLDPDVVKLFFEEEPTQISALLLARLSDELILKVFSDLDPGLRNGIFHAFLNNNKLDPDIQDMLETDLITLVEESKPDEGNKREIEKAVGLINQFPAETSDNLVGFLEGSSPEIAAIIKKSLFKFSSVDLISKEDRSVLFDGVQTEELTKALTGASDSIREAVLEVLSQRNRRMVEAELARGVTSESEADKSQKSIAVLALNLAKTGKITLPETD